ncbi:MAG TPA: hypothetical protein VEG65_07585 [Candidatus Bathyarchaeia archaeon]|nr:hypothetical protein [Candidatus Bathyarchaeia archaeon]
MSRSQFHFYRTFVPALHGLKDPVVLSFDDASFAKARAADPAEIPHHFIHSGNFFSPPYSKKPELRTKERVLSLQEKLMNDRTDGLMTLNVPVGSDFKVPYWKHAKADRLRALETSLEAALWAGEHAQRPELLYAGFEVGTFHDALHIFARAFNADFMQLSAGFGVFSRIAKFRSEDRIKQFEVLAGYNQLLGEFGGARFHASGGSSLNVLELLAFANVTSADGSTAVIAGLAYGSVLTASGRLVKADKITEWTCDCEFCSRKDMADTVRNLKRSSEARVRHNVHITRLSEARINDALANNTIAELTEERLAEYGRKDLWRCYALVRKKRTRS